MRSAAFGIAMVLGLLGGCAPEGVPAGADSNWSLNDGWSWRWQTRVGTGCIDWLATEDWADARATLSGECSERWGAQTAEGFGYFSATDELVFGGFWPWSAEIHSALIVYDKEGMIDHIMPCPYTLEPEQLHLLRQFTGAALKAELSQRERAMLERVNAHLDATDGASLAVTQSGCAHYFRDATQRHGRARIDPWDLPQDQ